MSDTMLLLPKVFMFQVSQPYKSNGC